MTQGLKKKDVSHWHHHKKRKRMKYHLVIVLLLWFTWNLITTYHMHRMTKFALKNKNYVSERRKQSRSLKHDFRFFLSIIINMISTHSMISILWEKLTRRFAHDKWILRRTSINRFLVIGNQMTSMYKYHAEYT